MLPSFLVQWLDRPQREEWEFLSSFCSNGLQWGHTPLSHSSSSGPILYNKNVPLPLLLPGSWAFQPCLHSTLPSPSSHLVACSYLWASPTHDHFLSALFRKPDWLGVHSTPHTAWCKEEGSLSILFTWTSFCACGWLQDKSFPHVLPVIATVSGSTAKIVAQGKHFPSVQVFQVMGNDGIGSTSRKVYHGKTWF